MPTFGSLFSGIGGLDLGLERAGWECRWQVEIDEWCRAVLARHWPGVPRWDDAKTFPPDTYRGRLTQQSERDGEAGSWWPSFRDDPKRLAVDLICGGFPCQPVSLAGKRRGQDDERWLWPEFARIVRLLRPRYILVENVPGLLARGMGDVLGDLAASGYDCEWDCIPAAAVGAPHLRYRVFIVAYAQSPGQLRTVELEDGDRGERRYSAERDGAAADAFAEGSIRQSDWWTTEPDMGRVAHGVPSRVDRLRGLGNAVVPQVAEWIGRRLIDAN